MILLALTAVMVVSVVSAAVFLGGWGPAIFAVTAMSLLVVELARCHIPYWVCWVIAIAVMPWLTLRITLFLEKRLGVTLFIGSVIEDFILPVIVLKILALILLPVFKRARERARLSHGQHTVSRAARGDRSLHGHVVPRS